MTDKDVLARVVEAICETLTRSGPLTTQAIADTLGYPVRGIESILREHRARFECLNEFTPPRWRLVTRGGNTNEYKPLGDGEGLLSYMGYHVGNNGLLQNKRREILDRVMESTLPKIISPEYVAGWGNPRSQARLRKLSDSLAAFRRDRKGKIKTINDEAIRDWTEDLRYLKDTYWDRSWDWRW